MTRIRTLKPELWTSEDFRALDRVGRLAFICLICLADDAGRLRISAQHLGFVYLDATADEVQAQLDQMARLRMIVQYENEHKTYIAITNWHRHQKVDHPKASDIPDPNDPKSSRRFETRRERSRRLATTRARADRTGPELIGPEGTGGEREGNRTRPSRVIPMTRAEKLSNFYEETAAEWDAREARTHEQAT